MVSIRQSTHSCSTLAEAFERRVGLAPNAVALVSGDQHLTYRALDEAARDVAAWLGGLGLGAGDTVTIAGRRSTGLVTACVGAAKAGVAYVCVDPASPRLRVAQVVTATGSAALVDVDNLQADNHRPDNQTVTVPVYPGPHRPPDPVRSHGLRAGPRHVAAVIYTSGTTGTPRCVALENGALVDAVLSDTVDLAPGDRVPLLASVAFDAAAFELWATLSRGATLVIAPDHTGLNQFLRRHRITGMLATAALFHTLVDTGIADVCESLRWVLVGGEELSGSHAATFVREAPGSALYNCYGPTEATIFATRYRVPSTFAGNRVPIGAAALGKRVRVMGEDLEPVAAGAVGEVYIGGDGLARGYLGAPGATAARFVPDPTGPPGNRMYRTGDLARVRTDGVLDFAGRLDRQVKVSGHRVDPGEVEAALADHPAVSCAVVRPVRRPGGRTTLCAYVTPAGTELSVPAVRDWLGDRLPSYLVPSRVVVLDALPLTPNGKVDHAALPAAWAPRPVDDVGYMAPRTGTQRLLAELWSDVLGVAGIGLTDNFFELGGDSLASVELLARIAVTSGLELTARDLIENQTVGELADLVVRRSASADAQATGGEDAVTCA